MPLRLKPADHYWWLWLILSLLLLSFTHFQTVIPIAGWLGTVLLLRFTRVYPNTPIALLLILGVHGIAGFVGMRQNWIPVPPIILLLYAILLAVVPLVAYASDRLLADCWTGLPRTLIFPTALVIAEWAQSLTPLGGWLPLGNTQYINLTLMQIVSLTGIWGLSFLIAWFATIVNQLWESEFDLRANKRLLILFLSIVLLIAFYGGARLAFATRTIPTVQIAGIVPNRALKAAAWQAGPLFGKQYLQVESRLALRNRFQPVSDDLFVRTEQEARRGAKLIVWSEAATSILQEDEPLFIARAQALTKQTGIYLQLGFASIWQAEQAPFYENKAILLDPMGQILWSYDKARPVFPSEYFNQKHGTGIIPVVDTPYGRLATVICYDADFPSLVQQVGRQQADILFVPSNDGLAMRYTHHFNAVFRAIENGASMIRPTSNGLLAAFNAYGQGLGQVDHYANPTATLRTEIPIQGVRTLYGIAGDWFVYLCCAGFVVLLMQSRRGAKPVESNQSFQD